MNFSAINLLYVIFTVYCNDVRTNRISVAMEVTYLSTANSPFTMTYNGDDPTGIVFVEFFAPGEKYMPATDRQEISAGLCLA